MKKVLELIICISIVNISNGQHLIGTGNLSTCTGNVLDSGGPGGDYADGESITETYCSDAGNCISATFNSFATESCCDNLRIYDGATTGAPLIGQYQGITSPGTIFSSSGCLTFEWNSDFSSTDLGWDAILSCGVCPTCNDPSGLSASSISFNNADLSWTENGSATQWDIEYGVAGFSPTGVPNVDNTTNNLYNLTGLSSSTSYDFYVRADCGGALASSWVGPFNFSTIAQPSGSSCGDPHLLGALPFSNTGMNTNGFGDDYNSSNACNSSYMDGDDYVFEYTPSSCEEISITLNNADSYTGLFITEGCPTTGSCVNSSTGSTASITSELLSGGITYYIIISTWPSPQTTAFDINITSTSVTCPGDDPCAAIVTSVNCGSKISAALGGYTNSGVANPGCGNYIGGDIWYSLTIPASGTVDIQGVDVVSGIADLALAAYTASTCGGTKTLVDCNDNGVATTLPSLSLTGLTSGNTLYVRVWEPGNNDIGAFELEFTDPSALYCLSGDASMFNFPTDTCMEVTPNANSQRGCAWYQNTLDFSLSFDHTLQVYCGNDDGGADGMTFTFHNDPQGTSECGSDGQYLGAGGIQNALVIEIDTWDNGGSQDIVDDHIAIWTSVGGEGSPIAGPIAATSPASNIEDGTVHELRLVWNAGTNTLDVYFDGSIRLSVTDDFVTNVFGSKNVFWGSTGSTGGASNQYYVCPPTSLINPVLDLNMFDFNLTCNIDNVYLNWKTKYTEIVNFYEVQRSNDGKNFETVKTLNNNHSEYYTTTANIKSGYNFYRIREIYYDGKSEKSNIKKVNCADNLGNNVIVYMNTDTKQIVFDMISLEGNISIDLFTIEGKVLHNSLLVDEKHYKLDASSFANGIYYAKIKVEGNTPIVKKIYIQ